MLRVTPLGLKGGYYIIIITRVAGLLGWPACYGRSPRKLYWLCYYLFYFLYDLFRRSPCTAWTAFMWQNLTSVDVRFWRIKSVHAVEKKKISNGHRLITRSDNMGIQMKWKEITKTFMLISSWKPPLVSTVYTNFFSTLRVNPSTLKVLDTFIIIFTLFNCHLTPVPIIVPFSFFY